MSNELRLRFKLDYNPADGDFLDVAINDMFIDQVGADFTSGTQEIGTSDELIAVSSDIGTQGLWYIRNLDSTNFVEIGLTASYTIKILAGEFAVFRASAPLYAMADTSAVTIRFHCFEL